MKIFIMDLNDGPNGVIENFLKALRLATSPSETEIICFTYDEFKAEHYYEEFIEKAVYQLRNADIIMSFAEINLLRYLENVPIFRETLYEKINDRTPFFFQFMNMWEMYRAPNCMYVDRKKHYIELIEYLRVFPTGIRVYNSDDSKPYTYYTAEFEPAPINPGISNIFEVGRSIGIFEANLMTFGEGNSALLRSHDRNIHDGTRDPGAGVPDFERHSPFVIRNTEKHFGYFVSGTFLADKFHYVAEESTVPEANVAAISNLVCELQSNVRMTTDA